MTAPLRCCRESEKGVGCFARVLHKDMDKGDASYQSYIGINAHTGGEKPDPAVAVHDQ